MELELERYSFLYGLEPGWSLEVGVLYRTKPTFVPEAASQEWYIPLNLRLP